MTRSLRIFLAGVLIWGAVGVFAKTPDGKTPSEETICDNETGAAYGLCVSYCEAKDCTDPNQRASDQGCESVRRNFEKKTGRPLPCLARCPCGDTLQLFADILSGATPVDRCVADGALLFAVTDAGFALIDSGPPASCSVNALPPPVPLTPSELQACRMALFKVLEATGVVCQSPE